MSQRNSCISLNKSDVFYGKYAILQWLMFSVEKDYYTWYLKFIDK